MKTEHHTKENSKKMKQISSHFPKIENKWKFQLIAGIAMEESLCSTSRQITTKMNSILYKSQILTSAAD